MARKLTAGEDAMFQLLRKGGTYLNVVCRRGEYYAGRGRKPLNKVIVKRLIADGLLEESIASDGSTPAYFVTSHMVHAWWRAFGLGEMDYNKRLAKRFDNA